MQSKATTVEEYLAELPEDRRDAIEAVRKTILANLPQGYEEGMQYGMIGYFVPHNLYPDGYHCDPKQPLPFACLASQKNYMTISLMGCYANPEQEAWFRDAWTKTAKKLDMGKACVRFKKIDDVPLKVIAQALKRMPVKKFIEHYETAMRTTKRARPKKAASKRAAPKGKKTATKKKASSRRSTKK